MEIEKEEKQAQMIYLHKVTLMLNKAKHIVEVIADLNYTEEQMHQYVLTELKKNYKKVTNEMFEIVKVEQVKRIGI